MKCSNGHHLCQRCARRIQVSKKCPCNKPTCDAYGVKCPVCRVDIAADKMKEDKALETRALGDTTTMHACPHAPECSFTGPYAALVAHTPTCTHKKPDAAPENTPTPLQRANERQMIASLFGSFVGTLVARHARRAAQDAPYHVRGITIPVAVYHDVPRTMDYAAELVAAMLVDIIAAESDDDEEDDSSDEEDSDESSQ